MDQQRPVIPIEEQFAIMADNAPVLIWIAGTDKLCYFFNAGWLRFTGRTMAQEYGNGWAEGVHPDDLEHCLNIYINAFDAREEFKMEYRLRRHDGVYQWLLDNGVPRYTADGTFAGYIGSCMVIDELMDSDHVKKDFISTKILQEEKDLNQQLQELNDKARAINEALDQSRNDLLFAISAAGMSTFDYNPVTNKLSGNDQLKSWFGLSNDDEIALPLALASIAEQDLERVIKAIQYALDTRSGGNYEVQYTISNAANPTPRIIHAKGKALFNDAGQAIRLSGTLQDITEQKKEEQRKNDFIGMVSHELKTPLTSLTAIVQVVNTKLRGHEDQFLAGAMEKANVQVKRMSNMINGFLNISRLESAQMQVDKQPFDMNVLLKEIIRENELTISTHTINLDSCGSLMVNADRDKMSSVISNLISNAVKYSPKGKLIEVHCRLTENQVQVSVKDEGMGIKEDDLSKIFGRYYRVETSHTQHISGFGIGLYLSAEIIKRHDGKIWAKSEKGVGSTFYFSLPLE